MNNNDARANRPDRATDATTYHVLWAGDGEVLLMIRLRREGGQVYGEVYERGAGWVDDSRAFDVFLNGQDYDLVDRAEADVLTRDMDLGRA